MIYVSGCGNVMFHFGSNKLWKTVPTFGYMWKYTLLQIFWPKKYDITVSFYFLNIFFSFGTFH